MAAYEGNYSGYCSTCGSTSGCSCGCHGGCGYDYPSCGPDYNPINTNNSFCPNIEGSQCQGGNATGNTSCVNVSLCGSGKGCKDDDCCCKEGVKDLLEYLYEKSLEDPNPIQKICIYGDVLPTDISKEMETCPGNPLLSIEGGQVPNITITNDLVKSNQNNVSLCSISVIRFDSSNIVNDLRREFSYTQTCKCCCDCGPGIAEALYLNGLNVLYDIVIQDTLQQSDDKSINQGLISGISLVALNNNIAIFAKTREIYFGIPTCNIAKFNITPSGA